MAALDWQTDMVIYNDDYGDWDYLDRDEIYDDYDDYGYSILPDLTFNGHVLSEIDFDDEGNVIGVIRHDV